MSDRGRPRFLPPEDPSDEEPPGKEPPGKEPPRKEPPKPPLLPGLGEPSAPVRPVRPGSPRPSLVTLVVVAAGVAVVLVAGAVLVLRSGGDVPSLASGSPALSPTAPAGPEYTSLPDPCTAVGSTLPADVRSAAPRRFEDSCTWQSLRPDRSRSLDVNLRLERTDTTLGTSGSIEAAKDFADDLAYTVNGGRAGGSERDPERLSGLGDEAFAAQVSSVIVSGRTERTARSYDMGGAQVEVRTRNVVLTVKWRGADYPPGVRHGERLVGTRLGYPDAKDRAVVVAHALLAALG